MAKAWVANPSSTTDFSDQRVGSPGAFCIPPEKAHVHLYLRAEEFPIADGHEQGIDAPIMPGPRIAIFYYNLAQHVEL